LIIDEESAIFRLVFERFAKEVGGKEWVFYSAYGIVSRTAFSHGWKRDWIC
jgi:hypothetical protein